MIRCVVKGVLDAEERQKILNGGCMGISYENDPPGFENSITLSQESHRIIEVLDNIKGSDGMEVIIWKLAFF